jgi:hypothetical protein
MKFPNKLVAIVNKQLEMGVAMNALSHMSLGMGAQLGAEELRLDDYVSADNNSYPCISQMPYIILQGRSVEIKKTYTQVVERDIKHVVFLDSMTGGTYQDQLKRTKASNSDDLVYYGIVLYGPVEIVTELTRKFSLWQ